MYPKLVDSDTRLVVATTFFSIRQTNERLVGARLCIDVIVFALRWSSVLERTIVSSCKKRSLISPQLPLRYKSCRHGV